MPLNYQYIANQTHEHFFFYLYIRLEYAHLSFRALQPLLFQLNQTLESFYLRTNRIALHVFSDSH